MLIPPRAPPKDSNSPTMKPSSFRQDGQLPPLRYRTPSPPRSAFEPLSPTTYPELGLEAPAMQWPTINQSRNTFNHTKHAQDNRDPMRRRQSYPLQDSMSTFASIALSTTSGWPVDNKRYPPATPSGQLSRRTAQDSERPAKRARSEKLPSPEWFKNQSNAASRPATSYDSAADSRTMEAELLLNFSQTARFSNAPSLAHYRHHVVGMDHTATKVDSEQQSSARGAEQDRSRDPHNYYVETQPHRLPGVPPQHSLPTSSSAPRSSVRFPPKNDENPHSPEVPSLDFRHQLIEA